MNKYVRAKTPSSLLNTRNSAKTRELNRIDNARLTNVYLEKFKFRAYKSHEIKDIVMAETNEKCCYCGIRFAVAQASPHIEHYRPKSDNKKKLQLGFNGLGYYWLAAEWDNLSISCEICNTAKGTQFPLATHSKRYISSRSIYNEKPLLLNFNNSFYSPKDHFFFYKGFIWGISLEGKTTIQVCKLNRSELQSVRRDKENLLIDECYNFKRLLESTTEKILNRPLLLYRKRDFEVAKKFFADYLKDFPNNSRSFSSIEHQIIEKFLLTDESKICKIIKMLNMEEQYLKKKSEEL